MLYNGLNNINQHKTNHLPRTILLALFKIGISARRARIATAARRTAGAVAAARRAGTGARARMSFFLKLLLFLFLLFLILLILFFVFQKLLQSVVNVRSRFCHYGYVRQQEFAGFDQVLAALLVLVFKELQRILQLK